MRAWLVIGAGAVLLAAALAIDARIRPRSGLSPERAQAIAAVLSGIGRGDGAGAYRIAWPLTVR